MSEFECDTELIAEQMWEKINHFLYNNAVHYLKNNFNQREWAAIVEDGCKEVLN